MIIFCLANQHADIHTDVTHIGREEPVDTSAHGTYISYIRYEFYMVNIIYFQRSVILLHVDGFSTYNACPICNSTISWYIRKLYAKDHIYVGPKYVFEMTPPPPPIKYMYMYFSRS